MIFSKGAIVSGFKSFAGLMRNEPVLIVLTLLYISAVFLSRLFPEVLVFSVLGYFALPKLLDPANTVELLKSFYVISAALFAFCTGLQTPWHKINVIRTKLYRTVLVAVSIIVLIYLLLYLLLKEINLDFISGPSKSVFGLFPFLILFVSGYKIRTLIQQNKASGPLSLASAAAAELLSIIAILGFELYKSYNLHDLSALLNYLFYPLFWAAVILLVILGVKIFCGLKSDTLEFKLILVGLLVGLANLHQGSTILLGLYTGLGLGIFYKEINTDFYTVDLLRFISNITILFFAASLVFTKEVCLGLLVYLLLKYLVFKLSFSGFGKLFDFNESVFKNLGAALMIQDGLPLLFLFSAYNLQYIDFPVFSTALSIFLLACCAENLWYGFFLPKALKNSGEIAKA